MSNEHPGHGGPVIAEIKRRQDVAWRRWGPCLSERAWGTVREDRLIEPRGRRAALGWT